MTERLDQDGSVKIQPLDLISAAPPTAESPGRQSSSDEIQRHPKFMHLLIVPVDLYTIPEKSSDGVDRPTIAEIFDDFLVHSHACPPCLQRPPSSPIDFKQTVESRPQQRSTGRHKIMSTKKPKDSSRLQCTVHMFLLKTFANHSSEIKSQRAFTV